MGWKGLQIAALDLINLRKVSFIQEDWTYRSVSCIVVCFRRLATLLRASQGTKDPATSSQNCNIKDDVRNGLHYEKPIKFIYIFKWSHSLLYPLLWSNFLTQLYVNKEKKF